MGADACVRHADNSFWISGVIPAGAGRDKHCDLYITFIYHSRLIQNSTCHPVKKVAANDDAIAK